MNQAAVTQSQRRVDWLIGAFILATLIASVWLQSRVLVNHDVGWVLNSAGRLLEGARFGSDVVAANPPLIWWLSLPAAAVSRLTVLTEVQAFRAFVWAVCLWSLGCWSA